MPEIMKTKTFKIVAFALVGALLGFLYYKFIGCRTGTCPITSNPYISIAYGAIFGTILAL